MKWRERLHKKLPVSSSLHDLATLSVEVNVNAFVKTKHVTGRAISEATKHLMVIRVRLLSIWIKTDWPDAETCQ